MNIPTLFAYLPAEYAETICKMASVEMPQEHVEEEPPAAPKKPSFLGTLAAHAGGIGGGMLMGFGAGHLANKAHVAARGAPIPSKGLMTALPVVGAGLGLAYTLAKAHEMEELRRALANPNNTTDSGSPGGQ